MIVDSFDPIRGICYSLAKPSFVQVRIYNHSGQLVRGLGEGWKLPGTYSIKWDGRNIRGREVSNGVYFCRIRVGESILSEKMLLAK